MPKKTASDQKTSDTAKKTTRKKKAAAEVIVENTSVTAAEAAETPIVDAPVMEEVPAKKKRGRKPGTKKAAAISETAAVEETPAEISEPVEPAADAHAKKTRKPRAKKADTKDAPVFSTVVQVGDAEYDITDITAKAYKAYKSVHKRKAVTDFRVYVKPEEGAAYYTVNGEGAPDYKIDL